MKLQADLIGRENNPIVREKQSSIWLDGADGARVRYPSSRAPPMEELISEGMVWETGRTCPEVGDASPNRMETS